MPTLLQLDTGGIQNYCYATSVLRESVGASWLVWAATEQWPREICDATRQGAVRYAGGGNALLEFAAPEQARAFAGAYSRRLLGEASGLRVFAASADYAGGDLPAALRALAQKLDVAKRTAPAPAPLLGLGVTAACESSGMPAVDYGEDPDGRPRLVSAETGCKRAAVEAANARLAGLLNAGQHGTFVFPLEFDHLGRSRGDVSYLSVVHCDGNASGVWFQKLRGMEGKRALSDLYRAVGEAALGKLVASVVAALDQDEDGDWGMPPHAGSAVGAERIRLWPIKLRGARRWCLPLRPLVFGGDDLTFVCEGRLGLALATEFLALLNAEMQAALGASDCAEIQALVQSENTSEFGRACAGVATVRVHYPFARAYALAEELLDSAKGCARAAAFGAATYGSAVDWHIASSGLRSGLAAIREEEYQQGALLMRPLLLASGTEWRTLGNFGRQTKRFREDAREQRSKLKRLQEKLCRGAQATETFVGEFWRDLPPMEPAPGNAQYRQTGWAEGQCVYFDALEALDLYWELEKKEAAHA